RLEEVDLLSCWRLAWVLPAEQRAGRKEDATAVELAEFLGQHTEGLGEELLDLAAASQDALVEMRVYCEDSWAFQGSLLRVEGYHTRDIVAVGPRMPLFVNVAHLRLGTVRHCSTLRHCRPPRSA